MHTNGSAEHIVPLLIYITFFKQEGCYSDVQCPPTHTLLHFFPLHFPYATINEGRMLPFENLSYDIASAKMNVYRVKPV